MGYLVSGGPRTAGGDSGTAVPRDDGPAPEGVRRPGTMLSEGDASHQGIAAMFSVFAAISADGSDRNFSPERPVAPRLSTARTTPPAPNQTRHLLTARFVTSCLDRAQPTGFADLYIWHDECFDYSDGKEAMPKNAQKGSTNPQQAPKATVSTKPKKLQDRGRTQRDAEDRRGTPADAGPGRRRFAHSQGRVGVFSYALETGVGVRSKLMC
jgi:hypothetical protein